MSIRRPKSHQQLSVNHTSCLLRFHPEHFKQLWLDRNVLPSTRCGKCVLCRWSQVSGANHFQSLLNFFLKISILSLSCPGLLYAEITTSGHNRIKCQSHQSTVTTRLVAIAIQSCSCLQTSCRCVTNRRSKSSPPRRGSPLVANTSRATLLQ